MSLKLKNIRILLVFCMLLVALIVPANQSYASALTTEPQVITTTGDPEGEPEGGLEGVDPEGGEEGSEPNPDETTFEGFQISDSVIMDKYLYSALLNLYKSVDPNYSGSVIYSDMFKTFETINIDKKNITSLDGMEKLELDNLVSFSANLNSITSFKTSVLQNIDEDKFTSLSLAGNSISDIDLTALDNLTYVDLSSNSLTSIDLSGIEGRVLGTNINLNLANNKIKSIKDIVLPSKRIGHIELNIINNNITDLTDTYFGDFYTIHVGIQGFVTEEVSNVDTANNLKIYPFNISGLAVEIYKTDGDVDELVATVSDADIVNNFLQLNLTVGEYEYIYTMNGESAYSRNDYTKLYFVSSEFGVLPQKANYIFTYKGKDYEELGKVTGKVTVKLSSPENAKIFYQVNGGEWVEGNVVECDKGGSYSIKVKTVINGVESEIESVWVRTSLNLYVSDWLMLVLVLLLTLVLFLVVLPIVSKKYFKKD